MGLDTSVLNEGYSDPFLLVRLPNATIELDGTKYVFSGLVLAINYLTETWSVSQEEGNILHPHHPANTYGGYIDHMCFGGNSDSITTLFKNGMYVQAIGLINMVLTTYNSGSSFHYLGSARTLGTASCRCSTGTSEVVCPECLIKTTTGQRLHFADVINVGSDIEPVFVSKESGSRQGFVPCENCGRRILPDKAIYFESGGTGCRSCAIKTHYGYFKIDEIVSGFAMYGGEKEINIPIECSHDCSMCDRTVDKNEPLCNVSPCEARSQGV